MEGIDKREKSEETSKEQVQHLDEISQVSKAPRKKMLKEKLVTAALVGGLLGSGCSVGKEPSQAQSTEPIEFNQIEEVLDKEDIEKDFFNETVIFEQILAGNDNFEINFSDNIREYIDSIRISGSEVLKYPVFEVKKGQDHLEQVEKFVQAITQTKVESEYDSVNYITKWEVDSGSISYKKIGHVLEFDFKTPISFPGIQIDPESKGGIEEGLKKISSEFFTKDLDYRVDEIVKEGDYYRVKYSRLLNNVPIYEKDYPRYLVFSQKGELKEGQIWLKEFEKVGEVTLLSGDEFTKNINSEGYPKTVLFSFSDPDVMSNYPQGDYPYFSNEKGLINLQKGELVYYYRAGSQPVIPTLLLGGKGLVEVEENIRAKANFDVLANALSFEHVANYTKDDK